MRPTSVPRRCGRASRVARGEGVAGRPVALEQIASRIRGRRSCRRRLPGGVRGPLPARNWADGGHDRADRLDRRPAHEAGGTARDEDPWIEQFGGNASYFASGGRSAYYYRRHYPLTTEARAMLL